EDGARGGGGAGAGPDDEKQQRPTEAGPAEEPHERAEQAEPGPRQQERQQALSLEEGLDAVAEIGLRERTLCRGRREFHDLVVLQPLGPPSVAEESRPPDAEQTEDQDDIAHGRTLARAGGRSRTDHEFSE